VGRWLRRSGYVPDVVLCSPARRARETWALVAAELGAEPHVSYEPRIYQATALSLLHLLREAGGKCRNVLLIGHNPGLAELAVGIAQVTDGPEVRPLERARAKFPTAAVAVLEFSGDWAGLTAGEARMVDFAIPHDMSS
jgi:phosphohistidine phosphatase